MSRREKLIADFVASVQAAKGGLPEVVDAMSVRAVDLPLAVSRAMSAPAFNLQRTVSEGLATRSRDLIDRVLDLRN